MKGFMQLFRLGHDTAEIADMLGEPEHLVYNHLYRERLLETPPHVRKNREAERKLVAYWNGTNEGMGK